MSRSYLLLPPLLALLVNAAHDFLPSNQAWAAEVQVTLFGKKCLISGPFTAKELEAVHSISPEKIPPVFSLKQVREMLDRLRDIKKGSTPALLDSYLDRLKKRLGAIEAFYDGVDAVRTTQKTTAFYEKVNSWIGTRGGPELKTQIENLAKDGSNASLRDQALDTYQKFIEPDPESEFHRVTKRLKIKYNCNFEEED